MPTRASTREVLSPRPPSSFIPNGRAGDEGHGRTQLAAMMQFMGDGGLGRYGRAPSAAAPEPSPRVRRVLNAPAFDAVGAEQSRLSQTLDNSRFIVPVTPQSISPRRRCAVSRWPSSRPPLDGDIIDMLNSFPAAHFLEKPQRQTSSNARSEPPPNVVPPLILPTRAAISQPPSTLAASRPTKSPQHSKKKKPSPRRLSQPAPTSAASSDNSGATPPPSPPSPHPPGLLTRHHLSSNSFLLISSHSKNHLPCACPPLQPPQHATEAGLSVSARKF
jgi:hypothetical protein